MSSKIKTGIKVASIIIVYGASLVAVYKGGQLFGDKITTPIITKILSL